ncbi:hypothetical protein VNO77_03591 [Canavalia gladiata]|uniref:Uncharacterized protein n=1 Tax=Canavalia gladiata TaxID=3824 RepID=A0AAN9N049_CANGL
MGLHSRAMRSQHRERGKEAEHLPQQIRNIDSELRVILIPQTHTCQEPSTQPTFRTGRYHRISLITIPRKFTKFSSHL